MFASLAQSQNPICTPHVVCAVVAAVTLFISDPWTWSRRRVRLPWRVFACTGRPRARACVVSLVVCLASVGGGEFRCRILLSRELVREIESKRERGRKKLRGRGLLRDLRGLSPPQKHRKKRGVALRFLSPVLCFCPVLPLCRATVVAIPVTKATRASVDVRARARARSSGVGWVG